MGKIMEDLRKELDDIGESIGRMKEILNRMDNIEESIATAMLAFDEDKEDGEEKKPKGKRRGRPPKNDVKKAFEDEGLK